MTAVNAPNFNEPPPSVDNVLKFRAFGFVNVRIPAATVVTPENVLVPAKLSVPEPTCVSEPEPEITPAIVPLTVELKTSEPELLMLPVYEPLLNELDTINAPAGAIVTDPAYAFAPLNLSVPPLSTSPPAPESTPTNVPPVVVLKTSEPALLIFPVYEPEFSELATITAPIAETVSEPE